MAPIVGSDRATPGTAGIIIRHTHTHTRTHTHTHTHTHTYTHTHTVTHTYIHTRTHTHGHTHTHTHTYTRGHIRSRRLCQRLMDHSNVSMSASIWSMLLPMCGSNVSMCLMKLWHNTTQDGNVRKETPSKTACTYMGMCGNSRSRCGNSSLACGARRSMYGAERCNIRRRKKNTPQAVDCTEVIQVVDQLREPLIVHVVRVERHRAQHDILINRHPRSTCSLAHGWFARTRTMCGSMRSLKRMSVPMLGPIMSLYRMSTSMCGSNKGLRPMMSAMQLHVSLARGFRCLSLTAHVRRHVVHLPHQLMHVRQQNIAVRKHLALHRGSADSSACTTLPAH